MWELFWKTITGLVSIWGRSNVPTFKKIIFFKWLFRIKCFVIVHKNSCVVPLDVSSS